MHILIVKLQNVVPFYLIYVSAMVLIKIKDY